MDEVYTDSFLLFYILTLYLMVRRFWGKDKRGIKLWCYALLLTPLFALATAELVMAWINALNRGLALGAVINAPARLLLVWHLASIV